MRYKLLLLFFSVIIFSNILFAQDYYALYEKYLPQGHLDYFNKDVLSNQFARDAALDPGIIYWRINYLNKLINDKNDNSETNGLNYLRVLGVEKLSEKNDWINNQLLILDQKYKGTYYYKNIQSLLQEKVTTVVQLQLKYTNDEKLKENFNSFLVYKTLAPDSSFEYDSTRNYSLLQTTKENLILAQIKYDWENAKYNHAGSKNFFGQIFNNWFLFNRKDMIDTLPDLPTMLNDYYTGTDFSIQLVDYYGTADSSKSLKKFSIQAGYLNRFFLNTTTLSVSSIPGIPNALDFSSLKDMNIASLQFSYKFYMRRTNLLLSYINTSLFLTIGKSSDKLIKSRYYERHPQSDKNYISDYYDFSKLDSETPVKYGAALKATTPLLMIKNFFYVEGGFLGGIEMMSYNYTIHYNHSRVQVTWSSYSQNYQNTLLINDKDLLEKGTAQIKKFYISPVASVNFELLQTLKAEVFFCYNQTGFNIGFAF